MDVNQTRVLEEINQVIQVPIKFIHVTRNPFDNISTMMLRATGSRDAVREEGVKITNTTELDQAIEKYFEKAASSQRVRERYGDAVIDIPGHETVLRPKETLQRLCDHLGVTCSEDYFEKMQQDFVWSSFSHERQSSLDRGAKARVTKMMKNYTFLKEYSFDEYPN
ncbi:hypothetical protein OS493_016631 [Desmophyllum pertusum]|uniref:Protein-tyrosine sulfotransferase n=1 Tax=Desmophyllum pertusum TaxID=174260 RepID=A0A9X0CZN8_9CNID|nr:hypothetical protein OS493_016631 [Desmophyllum pertusum]